MTEELTILDPASHLNSDQAIADCICSTLETGAPGAEAHALGVVFLAKDMTETALWTRLSRDRI